MMKLLILGAGGHGRVCGEIATSCGYEVEYLDDNTPEAVGRLDSFKEVECDCFFVAIGNPELREEWMSKIHEAGFKAVVSKSAVVEEGCVIMPGAIIQANTKIGKGTIVSAGAIVDHDSVVGEFCHLNCGSVVAAGSSVKEKTKVDCGEVWRCTRTV